MGQRDFLQRFLFESLGIRGERVRLDESLDRILRTTPYPAPIASVLGESLCAALLLSATIKFKGALILQIQSRGTLKTLVAQATDQRTVRGLARWSGEPESANLSVLCPEAKLVITIQNQHQPSYQGITPVEHDRIAETVEAYFDRSEQLATRLWLFASSQSAHGLFLQKLPGVQADPEDWNRILHLSETITQKEMEQLTTEQLLNRLYHEEDIRLFDPEPVSYRCDCGRDRIRGVLLSLGRSEIDELLKEEETVSVQCEFCNRTYQFDGVDLGALFAQGFTTGPQRH